MTPQQIQLQYKQAVAQIQSGQTERAAVLLKTLLLPSQGAAEIHFQLARIAELQGDTPGQIAALDKALHKRPNEEILLRSALEAHARLGDHDAVLALHDRLIALKPSEIKPRAEKALYLQNAGEFDAAETLLRKMIRQHPQETELYRMLAGGKRFQHGDRLIGQMRKLWTDPRINDHGRMQLGFALAKAAEDTGETDRVFSYLRTANAAQGRLAPFDEAGRDAEWRAYSAAQEMTDYSPVGDPPAIRPVFVTGLARSGTTLVEQIIAAHSAARAGGEMRHGLQEATSRFGISLKNTALKDMSDKDLRDWAEAYLRLVRRDTGAAPGVVTDKGLQSHLIYGLIARALPGARIIVVRRDPRDIAVSIYKNHFRLGTHRYACDLGHIARTIKLFRETVALWQERLPGRIHEISYDALVADPEPQARALIDAAGLDWEDACLDFHRSKAQVKTLSLMQVRQPIHKGRSGAWQRYETELAPFFDAWGDAAWD